MFRHCRPLDAVDEREELKSKLPAARLMFDKQVAVGVLRPYFPHTQCVPFVNHPGKPVGGGRHRAIQPCAGPGFVGDNARFSKVWSLW